MLAVPLLPAQIQPLLREHCQQCHNDSTKSSGLALTSRESILAGGNRGPAIKPGAPSESLIVKAVEQSGDLKMPPGRKLPPDQIAVIRQWIESGAEWPKEETAGKPKGADWWA